MLREPDEYICVSKSLNFFNVTKYFKEIQNDNYGGIFYWFGLLSKGSGWSNPLLCDSLTNKPLIKLTASSEVSKDIDLSLPFGYVNRYFYENQGLAWLCFQFTGYYIAPSAIRFKNGDQNKVEIVKLEGSNDGENFNLIHEETYNDDNLPNPWHLTNRGPVDIKITNPCNTFYSYLKIIIISPFLETNPFNICGVDMYGAIANK